MNCSEKHATVHVMDVLTSKSDQSKTLKADNITERKNISFVIYIIKDNDVKIS